MACKFDLLVSSGDKRFVIPSRCPPYFIPPESSHTPANLTFESRPRISLHSLSKSICVLYNISKYLISVLLERSGSILNSNMLQFNPLSRVHKATEKKEDEKARRTIEPNNQTDYRRKLQNYQGYHVYLIPTKAFAQKLYVFIRVLSILLST